MKLLITLFSAAILMGCGSKNEEISATEEIKTTEEITEAVQESGRTVELKAEIGSFTDSDPLTINSVKIDGINLVIDISYSGGCEEHEYKVVGSGMIMKSLPPKRTLKIIHDSKGDNCRSIVNETLIVDISNVLVGKNIGDQTTFIISTYKDQITYTLK